MVIRYWVEQKNQIDFASKLLFSFIVIFGYFVDNFKNSWELSITTSQKYQLNSFSRQQKEKAEIRCVISTTYRIYSYK